MWCTGKAMKVVSLVLVVGIIYSEIHSSAAEASDEEHTRLKTTGEPGDTATASFSSLQTSDVSTVTGIAAIDATLSINSSQLNGDAIMMTLPSGSAMFSSSDSSSYLEMTTSNLLESMATPVITDSNSTTLVPDEEANDNLTTVTEETEFINPSQSSAIYDMETETILVMGSASTVFVENPSASDNTSNVTEETQVIDPSQVLTVTILDNTLTLGLSDTDDLEAETTMVMVLPTSVLDVNPSANDNISFVPEETEVIDPSEFTTILDSYSLSTDIFDTDDLEEASVTDTIDVNSTATVSPDNFSISPDQETTHLSEPSMHTMETQSSSSRDTVKHTSSPQPSPKSSSMDVSSASSYVTPVTFSSAISGGTGSTEKPQKSANKGGLSAGGKAGVGIIVTLCIVGLIILGVYFYRKHNMTPRGLKLLLTNGVRYRTYNNPGYRDDETDLILPY